MITYRLLETPEELISAKTLVVQNKGFPFCNPDYDLGGLLRALFKYEENSGWVGGFDGSKLVSVAASALNVFDDYGFLAFAASVLPDYDSYENRVGITNALKLIDNEDRSMIIWMGNHDETLIDALTEAFSDVTTRPATSPLLVEVKATVPPCPQ